MSKPGADPSSGISLGDALRLPKRHPACRRREAQSGSCTERENLAGDAKGKGTSGSNREAQSTDAPERGGLPIVEFAPELCRPTATGTLVQSLPASSESQLRRKVMPVERRGWVIAFEIGSTGNGSEPDIQWKVRQPSCGGTSRMTRECRPGFCELGGIPRAYSAFPAVIAAHNCRLLSLDQQT